MTGQAQHERYGGEHRDGGERSASALLPAQTTCAPLQPGQVEL
jgi:hypothetical protein